MKLKKTTAALLVAGLTVAGSSYAWANDAIFKPENEQKEISAKLTTAAKIDPAVTIDPSNNESEEMSTKSKTTSPESLVVETTENDSKKESNEDANENSKEENEKTTEENKDKEALENEFPKIPEGYTAGNLVALKQAYNNAGSENAKRAILKNAHKAIAKFEAKHSSKEDEKNAEIKVELEYIGFIKPGEKMIELVQEETLKVIDQPTVVPSTITTVKTENQISTKEDQKAEKKALKEQQKAKKKAHKEEHKTEKKNGKHKE